MHKWYWKKTQLLPCYSNYDDYSQGFGQIKETFRGLTKDDIIKPNKLDHDFPSTNVNDDAEVDNTIGYNLYVFDKRYQKNLKTAQPIKV